MDEKHDLVLFICHFEPRAIVVSASHRVVFLTVLFCISLFLFRLAVKVERILPVHVSAIVDFLASSQDWCIVSTHIAHSRQSVYRASPAVILSCLHDL
jgi:hypothetical protein